MTMKRNTNRSSNMCVTLGNIQWELNHTSVFEIKSEQDQTQPDNEGTSVDAIVPEFADVIRDASGPAPKPTPTQPRRETPPYIFKQQSAEQTTSILSQTRKLSIFRHEQINYVRGGAARENYERFRKVFIVLCSIAHAHALHLLENRHF